jgi:hypothetical protein
VTMHNMKKIGIRSGKKKKNLSVRPQSDVMMK